MKVSVVIPCYNVEAYLAECVASIRALGETIPVILVDNNSIDGTAAVIEMLAAQDSHVTMLSEATPGAPAARNTGLAAVATEWVQFLDADDLLLPDAFERRWRAQAEIAVGGYRKRAVDGTETKVAPHTDVWKGLFNTDLGITSSILWRAEAVRKVSGWDADLKSSQEYDLMFRCLQSGARLQTIATPIAVVRERASGQISQSDPAPRWHRYLTLRTAMLEHLKTHEQAYFECESSGYYQQLFDHIRTLSNSDPKGAVAWYKKSLPADFTPQPSPATGALFLCLMRIFGFAGATRIRRLLP